VYFPCVGGSIGCTACTPPHPLPSHHPASPFPPINHPPPKRTPTPTQYTHRTHPLQQHRHGRPRSCRFERGGAQQGAVQDAPGARGAPRGGRQRGGVSGVRGRVLRDWGGDHGGWRAAGAQLHDAAAGGVGEGAGMGGCRKGRVLRCLRFASRRGKRSAETVVVLCCTFCDVDVGVVSSQALNTVSLSMDCKCCAVKSTLWVCRMRAAGRRSSNRQRGGGVRMTAVER